MKQLLYILAAIITILLQDSCFRTKTDSAAELEARRIKDSLHADSVDKKRNTPDTTYAIFKRWMDADKQTMIIFDRVEVLTGNKAAEYSVRHKHFGENQNIVVNKNLLLETLPIAENAEIHVFKKNNNDDDDAYYYNTDSTFKKEYINGTTSDVTNLKNEIIIQIVILHRSIVYLRELEYDKNR